MTIVEISNNNFSNFLVFIFIKMLCFNILCITCRMLPLTSKFRHLVSDARFLSLMWERRLDDFTPVRIQSHGNVHVTQYNWREDSVAPKTKVFLPNKDSLVKLENSELQLINNQYDIFAEIPIKSPLYIKSFKSAKISVLGHEADIKINSENGDISLKSIKCLSTEIINKTGNINLNSIVSNCSIISNGNVTAKKVQGETLTVSCPEGNVNIGSLYSPQSQIYGKYGDVTVDNLHGNCKIVNGSGNITVNSCEDNLTVKSRGGNVRVTLQDIDKQVIIESFGGSVVLRLSETVCRKCMLSIQSTANAKVLDEVQKIVTENNEAESLIQILAYDAPVFVGLAESWGENIWNSLRDKHDK